MIYGGHFDVLNKKNRIKELESITIQSDFWNDTESANKTIDEMNSLKEIVTIIESLQNDIDGDIELCELLLDSFDEELLHNLEDDVVSLSKKMEKAENYLLLSGRYDKNNCLLEIHSGAGGTEACDWADMLFRMYLRYFEKNNFKYEVLSYLDGDEVGLKSASIKVNGHYAYGYLKGENVITSFGSQIRSYVMYPYSLVKNHRTNYETSNVNKVLDGDLDEFILDYLKMK